MTKVIIETLSVVIVAELMSPPEEGERYFNIFPPAQAENVVPMAQMS